MRYHRITLPTRYQIHALHQAGHSPTDIGQQLGFHRTTITKELKRVTPYHPELAHQNAIAEQSRRHLPRIAPHLWNMVTARLKEFHSPEQIYGRCKLEGQPCPSIEAIYQFAYRSPELTAFLRQGRKSRRHRSCARKAPELWQSITERPQEANKRSEIGHLEADLLEGKKGKGSMVVMEDRCSRLVTLNLVMRKTAVEVFSAMDAVLDTHIVKTITIDQGREFVLTEQLGQQWGAETYACHAHSPWEKGSVENSNGLIRQFFPKGTDFTEVKLEEVLVVQHLLNNRPRKGLGYRTPLEVCSHHQRRALAT